MPPTRDKVQTSSGKTYKPLQRGTACLPCRKRKLKCSGEKPTCGQCDQYNRLHECQYEDTRAWGKHRKLLLDINELQRQLKDSRQEVQMLTAALQYAHCPAAPAQFLEPDTNTSLIPDIMGPTSPRAQLAPSFPIPVSPPPPPIPALESILADTPLDAIAMLQMHMDSSIDPQLQDPPTFRQLEVTPNSQAMMLKLFFPHAGQLNFEVNPDEFVQHTEGPGQRPHGSLLNAMFLVACRFARDSAIRCHETKFRQRAKYLLTHSIVRTEDLCDCVRACCLLALYTFLSDLPGEALRYMQEASKLASQLVHIIAPEASSSPTSVDFGNLQEFPLSGSCGSTLAEGLDREQQLTLQQAFTVDRLIAASLGTEGLLPLQLGYVNFNDTLSLRELCPQKAAPTGSNNQSTDSSPKSSSVGSSPRSPSKRVGLDRQTISALRARAADLFWMTSRCRASHPTLVKNEETESSFRDLHSELGRVKDCLPSIHLPASHPQSDQTFPSNVDRSILSVHTQLCSAMLQVMRRNQQKDNSKQEACDNQVGEVIALIKELFDSDYQYLDPIMGTCWQWVIEYLLDELDHPKYNANDRSNFCQAIRFILVAMHKLAVELPVAAVNIVNVEDPCRTWGIFLP